MKSLNRKWDYLLGPEGGKRLFIKPMNRLVLLKTGMKCSCMNSQAHGTFFQRNG